jgi:hypothetical protein
MVALVKHLSQFIPINIPYNFIKPLLRPVIAAAAFGIGGDD